MVGGEMLDVTAHLRLRVVEKNLFSWHFVGWYSWRSVDIKDHGAQKSAVVFVPRMTFARAPAWQVDADTDKRRRAIQTGQRRGLCGRRTARLSRLQSHAGLFLHLVALSCPNTRRHNRNTTIPTPPQLERHQNTASRDAL